MLRRWVLGVLLVVLMGCAGEAAELPTVPELEHRINARNQSLKTCHCHVSVGLAFPPVSLDGDVNYRRPDKVKVTFDQIPPVLKMQKGVFTQLVPKTRNLRGYRTVVQSEESVDGHLCWLLVLTPRAADDNVESGRVWICEDDLSVPKAVFSYKNGASVEAEFNYETVGVYRLPSHLTLQFTLPHLLHTTAQADFDGYEVNKPLPAGGV